MTACASAPSDPSVESEIRQMYADLSARKWKEFEDHFAPGAVVILGGRPIPVAEFNAKNRKALENATDFAETCEALEVRVHKDTAQAWSRFRGTVTRNGETRTWSGVDAYTLVRVDGRWKIAAIAVSTE